MSACASTRKEFREIEKEGWQITFTNGGHAKLTHRLAEGHPVFSSKTPSDRRSMLNLRSQLRRALKGQPP
jgi:hypothetical protein